MHGSSGCMKQMVDAYAKVGGNLISVLEVPQDKVSSYGVIAQGARDGALTEVTGLVAKPPVAEAPSNLIISGSSILQPEEIGRAHVWTPVTNAHLVYRLLIAKTHNKNNTT